MSDPPTLASRTLQKSTLAVTELWCERSNFGRTEPIPPEDAYLVALQLWECPNHDLYFEGRYTRPENFAAGVTSIYDLRREPIADIRDPFHSLVFYLPRAALDAVALGAGTRRTADLRHELGVSVDDPVVRSLLSSLLPALAKPQEAHPLYLDHVALALTAHLAWRYGGVAEKAAATQGGLAAWQLRRAKERIAGGLHEDLSLAQLAQETGLSARHFSRAFRVSTGVSPHRWLLEARVDRAKQFLRSGKAPLVEVAHSCGFADQSHFTRVFTAIAGESPGVWRRAHSSGG